MAEQRGSSGKKEGLLGGCLLTLWSRTYRRGCAAAAGGPAAGPRRARPLLLGALSCLVAGLSLLTFLPLLVQRPQSSLAFLLNALAVGIFLGICLAIVVVLLRHPAPVRGETRSYGAAVGLALLGVLLEAALVVLRLVVNGVGR